MSKTKSSEENKVNCSEWESYYPQSNHKEEFIHYESQEDIKHDKFADLDENLLGFNPNALFEQST